MSAQTTAQTTTTSNPPTSTTTSTSQTTATNTPRRIAQIIKLRPEHSQEYIRMHSAVWPSVLSRISASNIHDYSIFYDPHSSILFASFTYTGSDYEGDMKKVAQDEETRRWWKLTDGMQESFNEGAVGSLAGSEEGGVSWWREVREVFYTP